jgi:hypothetical protein
MTGYMLDLPFGYAEVHGKFSLFEVTPSVAVEVVDHFLVFGQQGAGTEVAQLLLYALLDR